jgi:hypothetical protein
MQMRMQENVSKSLVHAKVGGILPGSKQAIQASEKKKHLWSLVLAKDRLEVRGLGLLAKNFGVRD